MPIYDGSPPEPKFKSQLPEGWHRVRVSKVVDMPKYDAALVVFETDNGEAADFVSVDPSPENDKSWTFWRLMGGVDFPSPEYWEKDPKDREPMSWDPDAILEGLVSSRAECIIKTEDRWRDGDRKANVRQVCSVRRDPPVKLEPGESHLLVPSGEGGAEGSGSDETEVPF